MVDSKLYDFLSYHINSLNDSIYNHRNFAACAELYEILGALKILQEYGYISDDFYNYFYELAWSIYKDEDVFLYDLKSMYKDHQACHFLDEE